MTLLSPAQPSARPRARLQPVCRCAAYKFPHRAGSGVCRADEAGPFCECCGQPAKAVYVDFGYGVTEYWGSISTHRDVQVVSDCCEARLFQDAELSESYVR